MKQIFRSALLLSSVLMISSACDSKNGPVGSGREAVKEVVTQPFNALESAKDSFKQSEDKTKLAIEELEKESK